VANLADLVEERDKGSDERHVDQVALRPLSMWWSHERELGDDGEVDEESR
jgi:hypothetical protein